LSIKPRTRKGDGSAFYLDGNATDRLLDRSRVADFLRSRQVGKQSPGGSRLQGFYFRLHPLMFGERDDDITSYFGYFTTTMDNYAGVFVQLGE
jgi:hypothetical protein